MDTNLESSQQVLAQNVTTENEFSDVIAHLKHDK